MYRIQHSLRAVVEPIPPILAKRLEQPSSSKRPAEQAAYASKELYAALVSARQKQRNTAKRNGHDDTEEEYVGVAVSWPRERRLEGKGKGREGSLVIWVVPVFDDVITEGRVLYVPQQLLPHCATPPLTVSIHLHQPIPLTSVILQPVAESQATAALYSDGDGDLDTIRHHMLDGPGPKHHINGNGNGHHPRPSRIIREGEMLDPSDGPGYRILMLEPVRQGVFSPDTRLIISTTPYVRSAQSNGYDIDDHHSESSHPRTHLSLDDFDPDAFLSASLSLPQPIDIPDGESLPSASLGSLTNGSNTSGSLTPRPGDPQSPVIPVLGPRDEEDTNGNGLDTGIRFSAVRSAGPGEGGDEVCWVGVGGLGRAGIFEGDWVYMAGKGEGRLVKVLAWERLDLYDPDLPSDPILIPPDLFRSLFPDPSSSSTDITISPTPFGARTPTLPTAKTITLARIATTEGVDKRYERSWLKGLRRHFAKASGEEGRLVRRGDVLAVPTWQDRPMSEEEGVSDEESDEEGAAAVRTLATAVAYFQVTSLSFDPLVPLDEDFRSSLSSKARAGELGVWADVGGNTRMVLTGVERGRVVGRSGDLAWWNIAPPPTPASLVATAKLRDLLSSCISRPGMGALLQLSILLQGARGSGKISLIRSLADELGFNVIQVDCFDIIGDTQQNLQGTLQARVDKAKSTAPSIIVLHHIEALAKKSDSAATGRPPTIVKVVEDAVDALRAAAKETGWPCVLMGTVVDPDVVPGELLGVFKQDIAISAPTEVERRNIAENILSESHLAPDVTSSVISSQTAALHAGDLRALIAKAENLAIVRGTTTSSRPALDVRLAGLSLTSADITSALSSARSAYSDSIGAPKIPNVSWDDIGGLAGVKDEILETIQLPLDHPELFASGLKKRSGILLYGPPGTGKTLLAKAVATSCSLNFFSVKGPELLNMYIGESEANVRRVFQRARDAAPCVVFMDELDSVAPKRGNQGDSGGVMDRIVSQLLAELDGMGSSGGGDVFVMGATNRPDLLDSALLRPGRFDRMVYLSPPQTRVEQLSILRALTRKFALHPDLDLGAVVERCGYNLTGADFYALASDAMLGAMTGAAERVDGRIRELEAGRKGMNGDAAGHNGEGMAWPSPLTPQYYLDRMATPEEVQVVVGQEDFFGALARLRPSVSDEEMKHYERVQGEFRGMSMGNGLKAGSGHD